MGGRAVSLLLPSGALWVFRATAGAARLALEPSVVFPADALEPAANVPDRALFLGRRICDPHRMAAGRGARRRAAGARVRDAGDGP